MKSQIEISKYLSRLQIFILYTLFENTLFHFIYLHYYSQYLSYYENNTLNICMHILRVHT